VGRREDVVIAVTGASAAIAGLVLVFLGVLVTSYQQLLGSSVSVKTLARFKRASWLALGVFVVSLIALTLSTSWLAVGGGKCFYVATLVFFFLELGVLALVALYSTIFVLLKG
jgi:hypothetical protein